MNLLRPVQVLSVTLQAGFRLPTSLANFVFDLVVDLFFAVDIVLTFFTAQWSRVENTFITNKRVLARLYLYGWFWVDVISTVGEYAHLPYVLRLSLTEFMSCLLFLVRSFLLRYSPAEMALCHLAVWLQCFA